MTTQFKSSKTEELEYPFDKYWHPSIGEPFAVGEGVYWLRMPLPMSLDHINLWLLKDGDGWVIVDSGFDCDECRQVWDRVFEEFFAEEKIHRIIITHFHPDHIGLAAWLAKRCQCPIQITQGELLHYREILEREPVQLSEDARRFAIELGFDSKQGEQFARFFSNSKKAESDRVQVEQCEIIAAGDVLEINGNRWRIVVGNGHSPEHACLFDERSGLCISGDQAIARISSNVSVYLSNRNENPLANWLDSCRHLQQQLPSDTLLLPAHQEPFVGIRQRMQQLIDEHHAQLDRLRQSENKAYNVVEACALLFRRKLNPVETIFATGETLSHINYLLHAGELTATMNKNGVMIYEKT